MISRPGKMNLHSDIHVLVWWTFVGGCVRSIECSYLLYDDPVVEICYLMF